MLKLPAEIPKILAGVQVMLAIAAERFSFSCCAHFSVSGSNSSKPVAPISASANAVSYTHLVKFAASLLKR